MPFINVKMLEGRTKEQKQELAKRITDAMVDTCGAPRDGTMVVIEEFDRDQWAVAGTLISERG